MSTLLHHNDTAITIRPGPAEPDDHVPTEWLDRWTGEGGALAPDTHE